MVHNTELGILFDVDNSPKISTKTMKSPYRAKAKQFIKSSILFPKVNRQN